jgi:hypothetical protein
MFIGGNGYLAPLDKKMVTYEHRLVTIAVYPFNTHL